MVAIQELIWDIKPDFIIESGIARGGSLIFYASILELLNHGKIIGIDIDIKKHNRMEIERHSLFKRIKLIEGSSIDDSVVKKITKIVKGKKKIMVLLDSHHTEQHVLKELEQYSQFVKSGSYIIVFDTIIENMKKHHFKNRPWDHGNNPRTAISKFLKNNKRFKINSEIQKKLLITSCPDGYLECIKN
jgi:cephalosporin hydroxylase